MTDPAAQWLPRYRAFRLPDLAIRDGLILPQLDGYSILNLPDTICRWLGVPGLGAGPLHPSLLDALPTDEYRRVVLVLVDALAYHRLRGWMAAGQVPVWERMAEKGILAPLTSIVPTTTSAALTSLWTGRPAIQHGTLGYELWLKEYGVVANMITHSAFSFHRDRGGLERAGFRPETFLPVPTLGPHLRAHGVQGHAFQFHSLMHSGLTRMNLREVERHPFKTPAELWIGVRQLLERPHTERQFLWVYWDAVDTLSHLHGPDDERPAAELATFSRTMEHLFLESLDPAARQDTLLILVADHGQIATRKDPHYDLRNHPNLTRRLHLLPTGENRLAYLFVRPGQTEAVREYLERTWPNQFSVLDSAHAVAAGLFGFGEPHSRALDRLGDLLVVAHGDAYLWWAPGENPILGRHGGLSEDEVLVPFAAAPIDRL